MTPLMHTVLRKDRAMLRCLLRHSSGNIGQVDCARFDVHNDVRLVGLPDILPAAIPLRVDSGAQFSLLARLEPHNVIARGHVRLATALLSP